MLLVPALRRRLVHARLATSAMFLASGIGFGGWAALIPSIQHGLGLGEGQLGSALLAFAVGAMLGMPVTGFALTRFAAPLVATVAALAFCVTQSLVPHASDLVGLCAIATVSGAFYGSLDVTVNAHASVVERAYGATIMSSLHALFSIGGLAAAGLVGGLMALDASAALCQLAICGLIAVIVLASRRHMALPVLPAPENDDVPTRGWPSARVFGIGFLVLLGFMVEGGMGDWSGVYFVSVIGTDLGIAPMAFAAFTVAMGLGRLTGDLVVNRLGGARTLWLGAAIGMAGLCLALAWPRVETGLVGFALVGIGAANIVPILIAAAGRDPGAPPGVNVSAVSTLGYTGLLLGPPLIGFSAASFGLRASLLLFAAAFAAIAVCSWLARPRVAREDGN
jgi:MFS family permease